MAIRRARVESVAGDELDLDAFVPAVERSVEEQLVSEERVRRSAEALRALKPDEAKALMMKAHGLSYAEIGERNGWSYTKVNRAVTEGRRRFINTYNGIEAGEECERFEPIVQALERGLGDDGPGAADPAAPAPLQRLPGHGPRAARLQAAPSVPVLADLRPHQPQARHRRAVPPSPGLRPRHGHRARHRRRRRRVATVGAVLGLCLGGAGVGTVCVVNGGLPDIGGDKPALGAGDSTTESPARSAHAKRHPLGASRRSSPRPRCRPARPRPQPTSRSPRPPRRAHVAARPRRKQHPASSASRTRRPLPARRSRQQPPHPSPHRRRPSTASKTFSPAEQEFLP